MLTFTLAVFLLIITPGPGVLSLGGVGAAYGWRQGFRYLFGLFLVTLPIGCSVSFCLVNVFITQQ